MALIIIGIILVALGVYLAVFQRAKSANVALEIQAQPTKTYDEVKEALDAMQDYDPNYREMVEFKGFADSSQPVITPYSNQKVAYYIAENIQVSETTEEDRDSQGNIKIKTTKHEDKLSEEESNADLLVKDNAGNEIVIETNGVSGKIDLLTTFDRLDRSNTEAHRRSSAYNFRRFNAPSYNGTGYRILGYKMVEKTIPLHSAMYVLGEAYMMAGKIYIGPPKDGKSPYIVTTKSEEQMLKSKQSSQTTSLVGGLACAVLGLVLFIFGIAK